MFIKKRIPRHSVDGAPDKGRGRQAAGWLLCAVFFLIPLGYMLLSLGIFDFLTRNSYANLLDWYGRPFLLHLTDILYLCKALLRTGICGRLGIWQLGM